MVVHSSAMLQVLGLGIEVWKHLLRNEEDNTFVYVCFTLVLQNHIPLGTAKLKPQLSLSHVHILLAQTGARQFGTRTIYTVPCLGMDLVILIFFLCLCSLSPLSRLRERARGIEREGEKTSLTEAQSIISQVFD